MKFRSDQAFTLKPNAQTTFILEWNPGGKSPSLGTGDQGPLYITAYPYHQLGELGAGLNVFDGTLAVTKQGVKFVRSGSKTIQHYVYSVTVRNEGPKTVAFMLTGSSVGEQL